MEIYRVIKKRKYYTMVLSDNKEVKVLIKVFDNYETLYKGDGNGFKIDDETWNFIFEDSLRTDAYQKCLNLIMKRRKTSREIIFYLKVRGFPDNVIDDTLEKLKKQSLIDDSVYITDFIEYQKQEMLLSRLFIKQKLIRKIGFDYKIEYEFDMLYPQEDEVDTGFKLLERKHYLQKIREIDKEKNDPEYINRKKEIVQECIKYLQKKGFHFRSITEIKNLLF